MTRHSRNRQERSGLRLTKFSERSRNYRQYGPVMLVDEATNCVIAHSLDLDDVEAELAARRRL
jgi:hypothetical protein